MKRIWNVIDGFNIGKNFKNRLYIGLLIVVNTVLGGLIWLLFGRMVLPGIDWLLCFMGYPAIFVGLIGGTLYLCDHEFT